MQIRRIVTGHDANGKAVVASDERLTATSRGIGANITGCQMWLTERMPVDNSAAAGAAQRAGSIKQYNYVGSGQGSVFRITEWAPGHARFPHRTETVDYVILLSGEIDCELEDGAVVHMKPGDVLIQRGTMHTWVNKGSVPAVTAFILLDAKPDQVNGKELRTIFPA